MKFKKQDLKNILSIVCPIANKNNLLPILSNIFIKAEQDNIKFISSDGENIVEYTQDGQYETGEYIINSKTFQDYINLITSDDVELNFSEKCSINSKTHKTTINLQNNEKYPNLLEKTNGFEYEIDRKELMNSISQVLFASSTSDIKIELSGVNFNFKDILILASSDGMRLAEKKINISGDELNIIAPSKLLNILLNILSKINDDKIKIIANQNSISFKSNNAYISSRLINGVFPNYSPLISKEFKTNIIVDKNDLINTIQTNALFSLDGTIKLDINEKLYIDTESSMGKNKSEIDIIKTGENNNIKFNYLYLLEIVENIKSNRIIIEMNDSKSPAIIKSDIDDRFFCVLMPMNQ